MTDSRQSSFFQEVVSMNFVAFSWGIIVRVVEYLQQFLPAVQ
jgi:hypothetical protein